MITTDPNVGGVWLAYYSDMSGVVPFSTEVAALRHAVKNGMQVKYARFGDDDWRTRDEEPPVTITPPTGVVWNHPAGTRETR